MSVVTVTSPTVEELSQRLGKNFFDYQVDAFTQWQAQEEPQRLCLYFRTGAGKSITALSCVALSGYTEAVVVAPPVTHPAWVEQGKQLGIEVMPMSHAKFRQKGTFFSRKVPLIADEFHLFGGVRGMGWKKLDRLVAGMTAPVVLASATPNYNDAERVYCIQHILDPNSCRGGYLQFLYQNCKTEQNPFGSEPIVTGFHAYPDAEAYLAAMERTAYVPDTLTYAIKDVHLRQPMPDEFETYGLNRRTGRIMASQMEARHQREYQQLVDEDDYIRDHVYDMLADIVGAAATPTLVFCNKATIAEALGVTCALNGVRYLLLTGKSTAPAKETVVNLFKRGHYDLLIGTATLATGLDGLDKMCDSLVILNDTDDAALRRQLIGRIMPRGADADTSKKQVTRIIMDS